MKTNEMVGKLVSIQFPTGRGKWELADNCIIDKVTEKAVHIKRGQKVGVIRDTTISRWVPKSLIQDKGTHFFVKMSI
jgi:hypothetical protein